MAKLIIIDGPSRGGKSTLCTKLHNALLDSQYITFLKKMPKGVDLPSYYLGMITQAVAQTAQLPKDQIVIMDRYVTSEMVYPAVFDRKSLMTSELLYEAFKGHDVLIIHLDLDYKNYIKREPKDNFIYTEEQFNMTREYFEFAMGRLEDTCSNLSTLYFDTTDKRIEINFLIKQIGPWINSTVFGKSKNPLM